MSKATDGWTEWVSFGNDPSRPLTPEPTARLDDPVQPPPSLPPPVERASDPPAKVVEETEETEGGRHGFLPLLGAALVGILVAVLVMVPRFLDVQKQHQEALAQRLAIPSTVQAGAQVDVPVKRSVGQEQQP